MTVDSIVSGMSEDGKKVYASSVEVDQTLAGYVLDGSMGTRWSSEWEDPQWIMIDLGNVQKVGGVILKWEGAYAKAYEIRVSDDSLHWITVYSTTSSNGGTDEIIFDQIDARYVMMYGTKRATDYGYSMYEFEIYEKIEVEETVNSQIGKYYTPKIYPNPSSNKLFIDFQGQTGEANIQLINLDGKIVHNQFCNIEINKMQNVDISNFKNGVYVIKVQTGNQVLSKRIVIE